MKPEIAGSPVAPPLAADGVTKRFSQGGSTVEALRDVSLRVSQGEFVAIMGASGSGKSTLLHAMAGLTPVDAGRVLVEGRDVAQMGDRELTQFRRRRIGLVFQAFNLIPALTAEENALLPTLAGGGGATRVDQGRVSALLDRLGIIARRTHRPDALSGGEQQRVAIARALITDPAIVLADEPTGSLDSVTGQGICRLLRELCDEQGRSIVVVTHEPAVARWAGRVIVLRDGRNLTEFNTADFPNVNRLAAHYQEIVGGGGEAGDENASHDDAAGARELAEVQA